MAHKNPFPDGPEKQYLRRKHLVYLADRKSMLGRNLTYFGLPCVEMLDVEMWSPVLDSITAVEREEELIVPMKRRAQDIGVRGKFVVLEMTLLEASQSLALDDQMAQLLIAQLSLPKQKAVQRARAIAYDVMNLDLYGGFLYPKEGEPPESVEILPNLIHHQAKHRHPFVLILTYEARDTGAEDYDSFILEALSQLEKVTNSTKEVREYYTAKKIAKNPPHLRRLRFCVPVYLHKVAHDSYQVRSLGAWYYKQYYHTALLFEPREGQGSLGQPWPPADEIKELLAAPLFRIDEKDGDVELKELPAPIIP